MVRSHAKTDRDRDVNFTNVSALIKKLKNHRVSRIEVENVDPYLRSKVADIAKSEEDQP